MKRSAKCGCWLEVLDDVVPETRLRASILHPCFWHYESLNPVQPMVIHLREGENWKVVRKA